MGCRTGRGDVKVRRVVGGRGDGGRDGKLRRGIL